MGGRASDVTGFVVGVDGTPLVIYEIGGGNGTLARDVLVSCKEGAGEVKGKGKGAGCRAGQGGGREGRGLVVALGRISALDGTALVIYGRTVHAPAQPLTPLLSHDIRCFLCGTG